MAGQNLVCAVALRPHHDRHQYTVFADGICQRVHFGVVRHAERVLRKRHQIRNPQQPNPIGFRLRAKQIICRAQRLPLLFRLKLHRHRSFSIFLYRLFPAVFAQILGAERAVHLGHPAFGVIG